MKRATIAWAVVCGSMGAASALGEANRTAGCLDAAGGRSASARYTLDGSLGMIGGSATNAADGEIARHGFAGQLTEVAALSVTGTPDAVNEGGTCQLGGVAVMDDDSRSVLTGSEIAWHAPAYPLASIAAGGLATAGAVFDETNGTFSGSYFGRSGMGAVRVMNVDDDNFGSYAGDGLSDSWQNRYFGIDNPDAAPGADPDFDTQDNSFECVANLVPTNRASRFMLRAEAVPGQPGRKNLVFSPRFDSRTYIPQAGTTLLPGSYQTLTTILTSDSGSERTVTDTNATGRAKFYRIEITNP